ncbi:MAG: SUMF1/EgtB/PvdO family nonheme iron enzyme [Methylococcales bacterium]|nr:SUMF1/EgtB/PvdO family nonheme iron enzyme [Methylococcales bacterium]
MNPMRYVAYCDNGQQSSACAFLAQERGYQLAVLTGGLEKIAGKKTVIKSEVKPVVASTIEGVTEKSEEAQSQLEGELEQAKKKGMEVEQELSDKIIELEQEGAETRKLHDQEYYVWQKERDLFKNELDTLKRKYELLKVSEEKALSSVADSQQKLDAQTESIEQRVQVLTGHISALEKEVSEAQDSARETTESVEGDQSLLRKEIEILEEKLQEYQHLENDEELLARAEKLDSANKLLQADIEAEKRQVQLEKSAHEKTEQQLERHIEESNERNEASTALSLQLQALQVSMQDAKLGWSNQQSELEASIETLTEAKTALADEVESQRQALDSSQQAISEQALAQEQAQQSYEGTIAENLEAQSGLQADFSALEEKLTSLQQKYDDEVISSQEKNEAQQAGQGALEDKLSVLQQQHDEVIAEHTESDNKLQSELSELQTSLESAQKTLSEYDQVQAENQTLKTDLESLRHDNKDLQATLTLAEESADSVVLLAEEKQGLEATVTELQKKADSRSEAQEQVTSLTQALADAVAEKEALTAEIDEKTQKLNDHEEAYQALTAENQGLEQQLNSAIEDGVEVEDKLILLTKNLSSVEAEKETLASDIGEKTQLLRDQEEAVQALSTENEALQQQVNAADEGGVEVGSPEKVIESLEARLEQAEEQNKLAESGFSEMKTTVTQLIQENNQLKNENKALEEQASTQGENESERMFDELRQEKNELNEQLLMTMGDLEQAHNELSVRHHETGELISSEVNDDKLKGLIDNIAPDEIKALQEELNVVREHSVAELETVIQQRDDWQEKCRAAELKAEKYSEEYDSQDKLKGSLTADKEQLEHSVSKLQSEYKKLRAHSEEQEGMLELEREENKQLRAEVNHAEKSVEILSAEKSKFEMGYLEEQHRIDSLENELSSRGVPVSQSLSVDLLGKRKNSRLFYLFAGVLFGLIFVNLVLIWEGNSKIYDRFADVARGLFPEPSVPAIEANPLVVPELQRKKQAPVETNDPAETVTKTVPEPAIKSIVPVVEAKVVTQPKVENKPAVSLPSKPFRDQLSGLKSPEFVIIPGGEFVMGNRLKGREQAPEHNVSVKAFAMMTHEVTFAEFTQFAKATGRRVPKDQGWGRGKRPVINVSWSDAVSYAKWLSKKGTFQYRLPSEAEWEYAAGGNTKSKFWWGYDVGKGNANCFDCDTVVHSKTLEVGKYAANPFKLHDVAGNVYEWVADCFHDDYRGAPVDGSVWKNLDCQRKIVRGGSFRNLSSKMTTTFRNDVRADEKSDEIGFRLVRSLR